MTDTEDCYYRRQAAICADLIEEQIPEDLTTEQLGDFWQHMTEACVLRLVRLKPEMVTKVQRD